MLSGTADFQHVIPYYRESSIISCAARACNKGKQIKQLNFVPNCFALRVGAFNPRVVSIKPLSCVMENIKFVS